MLSHILLAAALTFAQKDADFAFDCASNLVERCTPRDAGTVRGKLAANWILDTASAHGVDIRRDRFQAATPRGERTFTNLCCEFVNDPRAEWIVLLSHFDTKPGVACPGANDGASTTGLMIALAAALSDQGLPGTRGNLMLVWTDGEECFASYSGQDGFWGSRHVAERMRREGRAVRAAICLDMLGDSNLGITIPANGDETLAKIVLHAARRAGLADGLVRMMPDEVKDDHVAFMAEGWRAVDLIDFDYGSAPGLNDWWHTPEDTIDKISADSLLKSGRLVAELLNIIL